jgi:ABC-type phosphate/phosphonate transport system substrate-binding protein
MRLVLLAVVLSAGLAPAADPAGLKIGMPESMFRDVPPAMVNAMAKPFRTLFERQTGISGDFEILPDALTIAAKINDSKLEMGVFHGHEFAQVKSRYSALVPLCVAVPNGRIVEAYVVVNKNCPAKTIGDLGTDTIAVPRGTKAHCFAYVDKLRKGLPANVAKPTNKATLTAEEVLNGVSDGTIPSAVVDAAAFNAYTRLQPGAVQQLKILSKSESFPVATVAMKAGGLSDENSARVKAGLMRANQTAQGKPLMLLWNLSGFEEVPEDYAKQLESILKVYPQPVNGVLAEK